MNKQELVKAIAKKGGMTQIIAEKVLEAFQEVVMEALGNGEEVKISGFGSFEVIDVQSRTARNPKTGETVEVPAGKKPKFKFSKTVKEFIKG